MSFKLSTGLRNGLLATGSFKALMDGGFIDIYSGVEPLTADAALNSQGANTLLCRVSLNGTATGLTFDTAAVSGVIPKTPAETWSGTNQNSGTASFYRFVTPTDDGLTSTTQKRIQGTVGQFGAEMNLSSVTLTAAAEQTISHYVVTLPTL